VSQDLPDGTPIEDRGEDPHRASAVVAEQRVDFVDSADEPCPKPTGPAAFGGVRILIRG
jgi:hypothetical protein